MPEKFVPVDQVGGTTDKKLKMAENERLLNEIKYLKGKIIA